VQPWRDVAVNNMNYAAYECHNVAGVSVRSD
jgi:hypothetical protein